MSSWNTQHWKRVKSDGHMGQTWLHNIPKGKNTVFVWVTHKTHFSKTFFDQTGCISRLLYISETRTEKWFSVWKIEPETLFSMSRHFDQKIGRNDQFDFAFSPIWCTRNFNWWFSEIIEIMWKPGFTHCYLIFRLTTSEWPSDPLWRELGSFPTNVLFVSGS